MHLNILSQTFPFHFSFRHVIHHLSSCSHLDIWRHFGIPTGCCKTSVKLCHNCVFNRFFLEPIYLSVIVCVCNCFWLPFVSVEHIPKHLTIPKGDVSHHMAFTAPDTESSHLLTHIHIRSLPEEPHLQSGLSRCNFFRLQTSLLSLFLVQMG